MQRALVVVLGLAGGCGFSAQRVTADPTGDASIADTAPIDATISEPAARRRKQIAFDPTKVSGAQQDFPAWISLDDADVAARAQPDGRDIYFTAADGTTTLDHELQLVDLAGHRFAAWVRIPALSATAPTTIYVNYGDPAAAPLARPAQVFKSSFAAVWHFDDATPATAITDATGQHPGTPHLTAATQRAAGQLGSGLAFTGTMNERIEFINPLTGNTPHTISVWVSQAANLTHTAAIVAMGTASGGNSRWLHGHYPPTAGSSLSAGFYGPDFVPAPAADIDGAGLTYVVWVFEGANKKNHLYRNGTEIAAGTFTANGNAINTIGTDGFIGYAPMPSYGSNNGYDGTIDELRIATVDRSAGWIATEYANQHAPAQFYSVGPELVP